MKMITNESDRVYMSTENEPVTNSLILAREFDKPHYNVIKAIRKKVRNYSKEFAKVNFYASEYRDDTGKKNRLYELTRDGFWAIVFGFTGEKAAKIQEMFISEFNRRAEIIRRLEEQLREVSTAALAEPKKEYKHKYSFLQIRSTADGLVEHQLVSGTKTIADMDEIENHARLQYKRSSLAYGNLKSFITGLHPNERYTQRFVDLLADVRELLDQSKPRAYVAKIIQVPIFSMGGVPVIGFDAVGDASEIRSSSEEVS